MNTLISYLQIRWFTVWTGFDIFLFGSSLNAVRLYQTKEVAKNFLHMAPEKNTFSTRKIATIVKDRIMAIYIVNNIFSENCLRDTST